MSDNLRMGIIGIGGMGSHHARYLLRGDVPGAELVAVCDTNPDRLEWARENLSESLQTFDNGNAFFAAKAVDAVMIATPHYFHPPYAIQAFENGLHVLSEKPAGVYTRQVREMNEAAAKSDRVFGIMFQMRTNPIVKKIKELIDSGELGEIRRTNMYATRWFRAQSYYDSGGWRATWGGEGGGVLLNQCPHSLDFWQWTCGLPKRLRAFCYFGKYHNIEVEDDVTAYAEYENGATGLFITSTGESPGTDRLEVDGDRGKVIVEDGTLKLWQTRESVDKFLREYKRGFGEPECWKCEVPIGPRGEDHVGITKDWLRAIRTGSKLLAPGKDGIRSLELSNAMLLSSWTNDWVDIPVDEELFYQHLQEQVKASSARKKETSGTLDVEDSWH